jgi:hypothetical protein
MIYFFIHLFSSLIYCIDLNKLNFNISLQKLKVKENSYSTIFNILLENKNEIYEYIILKFSNFGNSSINSLFLSDNVNNSNINKQNILNNSSPIIYLHKSELIKFQKNNLSNIENIYLIINCNNFCDFILEYQLIEHIDLFDNFFFLNLI